MESRGYSDGWINRAVISTVKISLWYDTARAGRPVSQLALNCLLCTFSCRCASGVLSLAYQAPPACPWQGIKSSAEAALWFLKSYGMQLGSISMKDNDGKAYHCNFSETYFHTTYDKMTDNEKEVVEKALFCLEKFCGSDALYNDLVQVLSAIELPKLYQIVQCRNALNKPVLEEISPTPGHHPGSQRSLAKCLEREAQTSGNSCLRVRVSVDGTRISRKSNFVVMSYAMLDSENTLAASGNKVVGIVNAPETYNTLEESFSVLLTEVNDIAKAGHVIVDDTEVKVQLFLGGDMKFLLMVLGLSSATATHACPWCKVHKSYRHQTTYSRNYWNEPPLGRSIVELVTQKHVQVKDTCVSDGKPAASKYGQKQKPLVRRC